MNPILRNILAVIAGWIVGSVVNMALIQVGHIVYPLEGVDLNDTKALSELMPTLDIQYFIFPFLAHALGTMFGAAIAGMIAINHKMKMALVVGVLFLIGGVMVNYLITGPTWFTVLDIVVAYIPMAWIGAKIAGGSNQE